MDDHQVNGEYVAKNLHLSRYYVDGYYAVFGPKYFHKLCPDPLTEIIAEESTITNDEQIYHLAKNYFAYEIKEKISIVERNLLEN